MLKNSLRSALYGYLDFRSWKSKRKIAVIESDDWGSIRMRSKEAYNYFKSKGFQVEDCPYSSFDRYESNNDLEGLLEVLSNIFPNRPVFTMNFVTANPDFDKIRESGFQSYYWESSLETGKHYVDSNSVFQLYKQGLNSNHFELQFHGREHVNVIKWLEALRKDNASAKLAFDWGMYSVHETGKPSCRNLNMDSLNHRSNDTLPFLEESLISGLMEFERIWNFEARSFIAPCYYWPPEIEKVLSENNIKYIQGNRVQKVPGIKSSDRFTRKYHYTGESNANLTYTVRNCFFEPTIDRKTDSISGCLNQISRAFQNDHPAIISSHRLNYIGSINESNRRRNLESLSTLLQSICQKWPDVEFLSSSQLGDLIAEDKS